MSNSIGNLGRKRRPKHPTSLFFRITLTNYVVV